jgi:ATP-binding cassette subfamily B protein
MKALAALLYGIYGAHLVVRGEMTVGQFTAFTTLIGYLYLPLLKLSEMIIPFQQLQVHIRRFYEVFAIEPDLPEKSTVQKIPGSIRRKAVQEQGGQIIFDHVTFAYDGGLPVLREVDLIIEPETKIALQGRSGAGKTTLCHLIPRFYDIQEGSIKIDGRDVREYPLKDLRRRIALVSQIPFLFNTTIWENLTCGWSSLPVEKVEAVTQAVQAHSFISSLPQGYETVIGEQGIRLSLGQGRRIALARALLLERPILILDETFAFLDEETEERVQDALLPLIADKTVILVAHRASTARRADSVFSLEEKTFRPQMKASVPER